MTVLEIKNDLHRMVVETEDPEVLEQIALLFAALRQEKSLWDNLSDSEKQRIQKGLEDIREGRVKSHEEVRAKVHAILHPA